MLSPDELYSVSYIRARRRCCMAFVRKATEMATSTRQREMAAMFLVINIIHYNGR